ncbi:MAG: ACP S-malonyltransferase [Holosporaceae bacterium]|jgi:[acyl-carrier-protein] S-malonyltransferase|nr:ACP S-malonyltransferase [Holosporaceae bacterium]
MEEKMLFVFPGQGSQKIGMGKDIYDAFQTARDVFHEVDEAISFKLSDLIFHGTEDEIKLTENTQPALMTVSMAFVKVLEKEFGIDVTQKAKFFAGHSLGEYTALSASRAISLTEAAKALRVRGIAMGKACPTCGAMAAIIGLDMSVLEQIVVECSTNEEMVQIANDNSAGQVVISGHRNAVERAMEKSSAAKAKKTVLLEVSGPFHSNLMVKAIPEITDALNAITFRAPAKPIIANVTAKAEVDDFHSLLLKQVTGRVRWRESILFAESNSVSKCVEIGAGKVLLGLVKRISLQMELISVNSIESLENFCKN